MKVAVVGGGPGGLYAALLIKRFRSDWQVTLFEKNSADATYGWGVVFSDRTLSSFREADYRTYEAITDAFVTWDSIDIRLKDRVVRCGGQSFSGISRRTLLAILQHRCLELGVDLQFSTDIANPEELSSQDLVIAADGVHSVFRSQGADTFRPSYHSGGSRYIWFGTDRPFDSFTFIFRDSEHGLFQVHAYPFDSTMSTFIVECNEATWHRAGLDAADENESIAFCEALFAEELSGHNLRSNASKWISFVTLKNRHWRSGQTVILGDAAHTAHFSIGSGTKLAMEDAISLARALELHEDVGRALADYELDRRPRVERFQKAARQSQSYFENTHRYWHLDPLQFAFNLLSRSGRVDYNSLRLGDRSFVGEVDAWYAGATGTAPPPAFVPLLLGPTRLGNRIVVETRPTYSAIEGYPSGEHAVELSRAAGLGAGLVITDLIAVSSHARITPGCPGLYEDEHSDRWKSILSGAGDLPVAARIGHAGRRGATEIRTSGVDRPLRNGWGLLAPSPLPYSRRTQVPKEMDSRDMSDVKEDFVGAAMLAARSGFHVLIVDMAHGYLLGSWLSPLVNRRPDAGDVEDRASFPLEVFSSVRAAWPEDRAIGVSLSATDWARGGFSVDDSIIVARMLSERGCDFVEVRAGQTISDDRPIYDPYYLVSYSDRLRNEAHISTIATGAITTVDDVNTALGAGRADLCMLLTP
jgi:anthraniloyl-CoA monooxygenase